MSDFKVTTAITCDEALSLSPAQWQEINCIITGINQPGMDGLGFTELVRLKGGPPVIVMSGFSPELASQTALTAGAVAFLAKPFMLDGLPKLLRNILSVEPDPS
jgi:DNA-binding response OmpR family regulator